MKGSLLYDQSTYDLDFVRYRFIGHWWLPNENLTYRPLFYDPAINSNDIQGGVKSQRQCACPAGVGAI